MALLRSGGACSLIFHPSKRISRPLIFLLLLLLLGLSSFRFEKQIEGRVVDFKTGLPLADVTIYADQSGWGFSDGQLLQNKKYRTRAFTDREGRFKIRYRVGSSANLQAGLDGYLTYHSSYPAGRQLELRLKAEQLQEQPLPNGFLRLGKQTNGHFYGWSFQLAKVARQSTVADLFPKQLATEEKNQLHLQTTGKGGLLFLPQTRIGVDNLFLLFCDSAPEEGYQQQVVLDLNGRGGILFVRTSDGRHYAKIEISPQTLQPSDIPGEARDITFRYVYNPTGSRNLLYQGEGPTLPFPD